LSVPTVDRLREVESLRGLLACWVLVYHVVTVSGVALNPAVMRFIDGAHAVDVFIVVSGFVICLLRLENPEPYPVFLGRRYLRLFPAFAVTVTIAVALAYAGIMPMRFAPADLPLLIAAHVSLLHGAVPTQLVPNAAGAFLNPTWSISLEWQFYLIAPLMIAAMARSLRGLLATTFLVIIVTRLNGLAMPHLGLGGAFITAKLALFWVGIVSGILYLRTRNGHASVAALLGASTAGLLIIFLPLEPNLGLIIWSIFFAIIMTARAGTPNRWVTRASTLMASSALLRLGAISYSVYLVHEPLIWAIRSAVIRVQSHASAGMVFCLCALVAPPLTLAISSLLYRFVEKPGIAWGRRLRGATAIRVATV
jgi:peptidoglycan/LPS O-acetylase OafA/YrhL